MNEETFDDLLKYQEIEARILEAGSNYMLLVVKYMDMTQHEFPPPVTRAAMELMDSIGHEPVPDNWLKYAELLRVAKEHGLNLADIPLQAFGQKLH